MTAPRSLAAAPELIVREWLNTPRDLSLAALRGKVVVIEAFQMLCPGCVSHGLPQAGRIRAAFSPDDVAVIGLHSVFEHHEAQGSRQAVAAFLHEYRIGFPVAIDQPDAHRPLPRTMQAYGMQGTPTLIVVDRQGLLRLHRFGSIDDVRIGALIQQLVDEDTDALAPEPEIIRAPAEGCTPDGCVIT